MIAIVPPSFAMRSADANVVDGYLMPTALMTFLADLPE